MIVSRVKQRGNDHFEIEFIPENDKEFDYICCLKRYDNINIGKGKYLITQDINNEGLVNLRKVNTLGITPKPGHLTYK